MTFKTNMSGAGGGCLAVIGVIALVVGVLLAWTAVIALVLSWAWNLVVPSVFGGPTLDFGAAFALVFVLNIIGRLLFGVRTSSTN